MAINGNVGSYLFKYQNVTPELLTTFRLIFSGLFLLIYEYFINKKISFDILKNPKSLIQLLYFGFLGLLAMQYNYLISIKYSNAATATILQSLAPFIIVIVVALKEKKFPKKEISTSLILALSGVFLLITHGKINQLVITKPALFFGFLSAVGAVNYNLSSAKLQEKYKITLILGWAMLITGIIFTLVLNPLNRDVVYNKIVIISLTYAIFLGTLIPFLLYLIASKLISPQKSSIIILTEPVISAIISIIFLDETFKLFDLIGITIIIIGLVLLIKSDDKEI